MEVSASSTPEHRSLLENYHGRFTTQISAATWYVSNRMTPASGRIFKLDIRSRMDFKWQNVLRNGWGSLRIQCFRHGFDECVSEHPGGVR